MAEDWIELIDDYNAAYDLEMGRERARAGRIQRVMIMVPRKR